MTADGAETVSATESHPHRLIHASPSCWLSPHHREPSNDISCTVISTGKITAVRRATVTADGYFSVSCVRLVSPLFTTIQGRSKKARQCILLLLSFRLIDWAITSHQTQYRSYRGGFLQVIWPNQQCQSTEENQLVLQIRLKSHQHHSTMLQ